MTKILVIDDEPAILESLNMFLVEKGYEVLTARTGREGLALFYENSVQIVILDIRLPDADGLEILKTMVEADTPSKIIMITAFQDMETTITAMRRGAFDYIHKPLDVDEIEKTVERAVNILEIDKKTPAIEPSDTYRRQKSVNQWEIIGKSEKMREIFKKMGLVCRSHVNVLIQGETGTGKELIARVIHLNSSFKEEPFIVFDCSAVVETLIESELFGHEKGAFTGADTAKKGKIELAGSGSLFLDEIAELPLNVQGKLLGFIQRKEYTRVGGTKIMKSNCRIISASNCDLGKRVRENRFKEDLFFRLRVFMIQVPPLRERTSDIPLLVEHFLHKINFELGTNVTKIQTGVIDRLLDYPWKGNVRELENTIVQALVGCSGNVLLKGDIDHLLTMDESLPKEGLASFSLENVEKNHILKTLEQLEWNRTKTAQALGITIPTLRSKISKYQLDLPSN